jgi:hypothetical protein
VDGVADGVEGSESVVAGGDKVGTDAAVAAQGGQKLTLAQIPWTCDGVSRGDRLL